jgi:hypothetical protein
MKRKIHILQVNRVGVIGGFVHDSRSNTKSCWYTTLCDGNL